MMFGGVLGDQRHSKTDLAQCISTQSLINDNTFQSRIMKSSVLQDENEESNCSLSLWRVVRGSKLMHLDLIHGLFIT